MPSLEYFEYKDPNDVEEYADALVVYEYNGNRDYIRAWFDPERNAFRYTCECEKKDMPELEKDWHYKIIGYYLLPRLNEEELNVDKEE